MGFAPKGPGTAGTLVTLLIVAMVNLPWPLYIMATLAVTLLGVVASSEFERVTGEKDPSCVIIDEVAGYMVTVALIPHSWAVLGTGFVLFRFFDIVKPPPIRSLQRIKGGWGVMVDDLAAGLVSNLILRWMLQEGWIT